MHGTKSNGYGYTEYGADTAAGVVRITQAAHRRYTTAALCLHADER